ncbi:MAG: hypothetical protein JRD89_04365, partial [Deltaproteobacteria bacterium]|nr:hypothetical protein [Deltaproteobacteria bacterium]
MTRIRSLCYKPFFRRPVIADWARVVPDSVYGVSASGLKGWWKFEEEAGDTAHDISGEGNHGTIYGAQRTLGKVGRALAFDGTDDYVEVPDSP